MTSPDVPEVLCLGELLIDFVPDAAGRGLAEVEGFARKPGGAPGNVAVGLARQGVRSGFLGKVGDDPFGRFLVDTLAAEGVDTAGLKRTTEAQTALAFVSLKADGDREFLFYRSPSADMLHAPDDIDEAAVAAARILHVGTISLIAEPARAATLHAVRLARAHGVLVSCDPNLREALWPSAEAARYGLSLGVSLASLVKISDYEVAFLTGQDDPVAGMRALWHEGIELAAVTLGPDGCALLTPEHTVRVPGFAVASVDTTGAGDAFTATLLAGLLHDPEVVADAAALHALGRRANAAGALTTMTYGAIPALPTAADLDGFLASAG